MIIGLTVVAAAYLALGPFPPLVPPLKAESPGLLWASMVLLGLGSGCVLVPALPALLEATETLVSLHQPLPICFLPGSTHLLDWPSAPPSPPPPWWVAMVLLGLGSGCVLVPALPALLEATETLVSLHTLSSSKRLLLVKLHIGYICLVGHPLHPLPPTDDGSCKLCLGACPACPPRSH